MPPPSPAPGSAHDWLARAQGRLALARVPLPPGGFLEDLCFSAHQAAELAIKAVFQQHGWRFAYTHDLDALLTELAGQGLTIPAGVQEADQLTPYSTQFRYPGAPAVTQTHYQEAVHIAEAVVAWATSLIP